MFIHLDLLHLTRVQIEALRSAHDYCESLGFCFASLVKRFSEDEKLQDEVLNQNHMSLEELVTLFYYHNALRFDMLDILMTCYPDALLNVPFERVHLVSHDLKDVVLAN